MTASAMAAARMKPEYGPSLARLLAPRWRRASPLGRVAASTAVVAVVAALLAAGLTLENATFARGGSVPFSFAYRGLYRVAPDPGGFVKIQSHWADGALKYSYAVSPLVLPPYRGLPTAELPLYANRFIRGLRRRYEGFAVRAEGKTKVNNTLTGYQVAFYAEVEGREMYARAVLLLPPQAHPREGVVVTMLTAPKASTQIDSPLEVAETGVLLRPLKTFTFG
jgi:hypothetical protein